MKRLYRNGTWAAHTHSQAAMIHHVLKSKVLEEEAWLGEGPEARSKDSPEDDLVKREKREHTRLVSQVIGQLTLSEQAVICERFFNDQSVIALAHQFGVTRQRIKHVEERALRRIQKRCAPSVLQTLRDVFL